MKNVFKVLGIIALSAVIGFTFVTCDDSGDSGENLSGKITITPNADTATGTELTANYSGDEEGIVYQWKKGKANVGENSDKFTPSQAGIYTVTVSASGYNSKTSSAVTIFSPIKIVSA